MYDRSFWSMMSAISGRVHTNVLLQLLACQALSTKGIKILMNPRYDIDRLLAGSSDTPAEQTEER